MKKALLNALILAQPFVVSLGFAADDLALLEISLADPQASEAYLPQEPLRLQLPDQIPAELLLQLSVELNSIDVTALVQYDDGALLFTPVRPLPSGQHELRVVGYGDDGSVHEVGYWLFNVRTPGFFQDSSLTGQVDLSATQRLAESSDYSSDNASESAFSAQGSGSFQGSSTTDIAHLSGHMDILYADNTDYSASGKALDLGTFLATAQGEHFGVNVGHHAVASSDLLFDGYEKRGVSINSQWQPMNTQLTLFGMSAQDQVGARDTLGLNDNDNLYQGGVMHTRLWSSASHEGHLSAGFISGKRGDAGYGNWQQQALITEGSGWNMALDTHWFTHQLRMRVERAATDTKLLGMDADKHSDSAYSALVVATPTLDEGVLSLGAEVKQVGLAYQSLANPFLPADRNSKRLFTQYATGNWSVNASLGTEHNNTDNDPARSLTKLHQARADITYSHFYSNNDAEVERWRTLLGSPSLNLAVERNKFRDARTAEGFARQDMLSESVSLSAAFAASRWSWSVGSSYQTFDDFTDFQSDSRIHSVFANANFPIGSRVTLQPGWERQRMHNRDYDAVSYNTLFSLSSSVVILPERLKGELSFISSDNRALNDPFYLQDNRNQYLAAELLWHAKKPKPNRFGLDVSLSLSNQDYRDRLFGENNNDNYQVFLTLRTTLPIQSSGVAQ
ncbi:hypothetical protein [Nitrincola sp. MINF-07-Sa-05]|uniref:hypothetical protein n=1 Tax=Nitrincola salilacus TaxID=3400273 RepID=UPI003917D2BB